MILLSSSVVRKEPPVSYKNGAGTSTSSPTKRRRQEPNEGTYLREPRVQGVPSYTDFFEMAPLNVYRFKNRPSLYRVLLRQFGSSMVICLVSKFVSDVGLVLGPIILG